MIEQPLASQGGQPAFPDGPLPWPVSDPRIVESITSALRSGHWGQYDSKLSEVLIARLAKLFQVQHVLPCSSGTIAVELALRGAGVKSGDEVILAAYDFPGNFRAIEALGARPVLVDVVPSGWTLSLDQIATAASPQTKAVLVSHLHGHSVNMPDVCTIAHDLGLTVIEDACQVPGGTWDGRPLGSFGDASVLSFGGSKLLSAGRGGAVLTNDANIFQRAKIFGSRGNEAFPLSQLQAAALIPQLETLSEVAAKRHAGWNQLVGSLGHESFAPTRSVKLGTVESRVAPYKVPLRVDPSQRDAWTACLRAEGIAVGDGFRGFASRTQRRCRKPFDLPNAEAAARQTILLHHPILLQPKEYILKVAQTLQRVHQHLQQQPS